MKIKCTISSIIICCTSIIIFSACDNSASVPSDDIDPVEIFEAVWNDLDENYSYFLVKKVNWDSLYSVFRPKITSSTSSSELFTVISAMLDHLKDGHVNLMSLTRTYSYNGWYDQYPANFDRKIVADHYLENVTDTPTLLYGYIKNTDLAYIWIKTFGHDPVDYEPAEDFVNDIFQNRKALVVDVRDNAGGSDGITRNLAGKMTDQEILYAYYRFKNGPGHNDFEAWSPKILNPVSNPFNKPIALLTNRRCYSSTEDFVMSMREISMVTVIGDTTGGGSGNPLKRELSNGWTYRFSHWQEVTKEKEYFENIGLFPDIPVWIDPVDAASGRDTILDRAIEHLQAKSE